MAASARARSGLKSAPCGSGSERLECTRASATFHGGPFPLRPVSQGAAALRTTVRSGSPHRRVWTARTPSETADRMNVELLWREEAMAPKIVLHRGEEAWAGSSLDVCANLISSLDRSIEESHKIRERFQLGSAATAGTFFPANMEFDSEMGDDIDGIDEGASQQGADGVFSQAEKALQDIRKDGSGRFNLHDVREVRRITNADDRVHTKVKYYRLHDEVASPVLDNLTRNFMLPLGGNTSVVNIAKVRNARRMSPDSIARDHHGRETKTPDTSRHLTSISRSDGPPSRITLEESSMKLRHRSFKQAESIARAREEVRRQEMAWRLQMLEAYEARQGRKHQAQQGRSCFLWIAVAMSMAALHAMVRGYRSAVDYFDCEDSGHSDNLLLQMRRKLALQDASARVAILGRPVIQILRPRQADSICSSVINEQLARMHGNRQRRSWSMWHFLLTLMTFVVRVRKPLRKHLHAEVLKEFIERSWRGYALRMTIKTFKAKVLLLQRGFRTSMQLSHIIKRRIYLPQVWSLETQILLQTITGLEDNTDAVDEFIRDDVLPYMERCDVERWQKEAQFFLDQRDTLLKAKHTTPPALPAASPSAPGVGGSGSPRAGAPRSQLAPPPPLARGASTMQTRTASSLPARRGALRDQRQSARGQITSHLWQLAQDAQLVMPPSGVSSMGRVLDTYRPTDEARQEVVQMLWRDSVERWWQEFRDYKTERKNFKRQWFLWSEEMNRLQDLYHGFCPAPPEQPEVPQVVLHLQDGALQKFCVQSLREGAAAGLLQSKDVRSKRGDWMPWHKSACRERIQAHMLEAPWQRMSSKLSNGESRPRRSSMLAGTRRPSDPSLPFQNSGYAAAPGANLEAQQDSSGNPPPIGLIAPGSSTAAPKKKSKIVAAPRRPQGQPQHRRGREPKQSPSRKATGSIVLNLPKGAELPGEDY